MPVMTSDTEATHNTPTVDDDTLVTAVWRALWIWDTLKLEMGEVALVTDPHPNARLIALAATWYGASPVLLRTAEAGAVPYGVELLVPGRADEVRLLAERLQVRPKVAAVDLSGRSEMVDLLLESLPKSSHLLLAGSAREALTVDYYINVHRKGLRLVSAVLDSLQPGDEIDARLERVVRLMTRASRKQACLAALRGPDARNQDD